MRRLSQLEISALAARQNCVNMENVKSSGFKGQDSEYILVDKDSELRCPNPECRKLLGKGNPGAIEIKCPRCKTMCRFKSL